MAALELHVDLLADPPPAVAPPSTAAPTPPPPPPTFLEAEGEADPAAAVAAMKRAFISLDTRWEG